MDNNTVYIHYGHDKFDKDLFKNITNEMGSKPMNGFWASRADSANGWKEFNDDPAGIKQCSDDYAIRFTISSIKPIYQVATKEDWNRLYEMYGCGAMPDGRAKIDWERMSQDYDGIEMIVENIKGLAYHQYWDCDSICIFNKDAIQEIEKDYSNDFRKSNGIQDSLIVFIPKTAESEDPELNKINNLMKLADFRTFCRGYDINAERIVETADGSSYAVTVNSDVQYNALEKYAEKIGANINHVYRSNIDDHDVDEPIESQDIEQI